VAALMTEAPSSRSVDAALMASELVTAMVEDGATLWVRLEEQGRRVRITVRSDSGFDSTTEQIVTRILDRLSDEWSIESDSMWFELEVIRRQSLSHLSDEELFALLPADRDARDELFTRYEGWASSVANKYRRRGAHYDDIGQAASIALVNAIDRFDPEYGAKFTTYARKTIIGTLKRYLRDSTWSVRVPRSLSDASVEMNRTRAELTQRFGRSPTAAELAEALGRPLDEIHDALEAAQAYNARSVDAPAGDDEQSTLLSLMGADDGQFDLADIWYSLEPLISDLSDREQEVLYLRYFDDMTQTEIAEVIGVSQMQVSRIISRSLENLRESLDPTVQEV
jgi:RNA polymerase sigma-B factor